MIATVPFAEPTTATIDFGPPSGSVSFASTSTAVAPESSETVAASATAVGGVLGGGVVVVVPVAVVPVVPVVVPVPVVPVPVVPVPVVPVPVVPVVLVGGGGAGTRSLIRNTRLIVFGGSRRSTSRIRLARTVILQSVPTAKVRRGVKVKTDAGDRLSENPSPRPGGHANLNEPRAARTRSLNRTVTAPREEIATETTRGRASWDTAAGTSSEIHDVPPATDTPTPNPSGAATATAAAFHHPARKTGPLLGDDPTRLDLSQPNATTL